ncbi:MAG: glycosyltransferase involved in cell wall biosynthesis [Candidatus Azotimanducaceae bacterium]|jgi:glycosyltransferase involved in cell wall biosynthesis
MNLKKIVQNCLSKIPYGYSFLYYLIYLFSYVHYFRTSKTDLVFVVAGKGWILERICKEIDACFEGSSVLHYSIDHIPKAKAYFFSVYRQFMAAAIKNPHIFQGDIYVYYTHYTEGYFSTDELGRILNLTKRIFVMNSKDKSFLMSIGVGEEKIILAMAGVDDTVFTIDSSSGATKKTVGFCVKYEDWPDYFERKNFGMVIDLIKELGDYRVILLGNKWKNFKRFQEIEALEYFEYVETEYAHYQTYFNQMDVFVSVSKLEGGPVPLLEAMFCGTFPVVSDTGFAGDVITNDKNGFIFDVDSETNDIKNLIDNAFEKRSRIEIRNTVSHLTWKNFGQKIVAAIEIV